MGTQGHHPQTSGKQKPSGKGQRIKGRAQVGPSWAVLSWHRPCSYQTLRELLLHHKVGMKQFSALLGEPPQLGRAEDLFR